MIILVEDGVFVPGQAEPLDLLELLGLGYRGWHEVQIDPPWDDQLSLAVNRWLEKLSPREMREQAVLALEVGLEAATRGERSEPVLRICGDSESCWDAQPPRLHLGEALRILRRPLQVMVEDRVNDGDFLHAVTPQHWRGALRKAMDAGQIEIVHGGGLPGMKSQIMNSSPERCIRLWALFDSDAEIPGEMSIPSQELSKLCHDRQVTFHRLQRRAAENYLPLEALAAWTHLGEHQRRQGELLPINVRKNRKKVYLCFKQMGADQRYHYPMRDGFNKYLKKEVPVPKFFGEFGRRKELRDGFSTSIRGLFRQKYFRFHEEWLRRDDQQNETTHMVRSIFRHL